MKITGSLGSARQQPSQAENDGSLVLLHNLSHPIPRKEKEQINFKLIEKEKKRRTSIYLNWNSYDSLWISQWTEREVCNFSIKNKN